jgi:hypothetical protein
MEEDGCMIFSFVWGFVSHERTIFYYNKDTIKKKLIQEKDWENNFSSRN